MLKRNAELFRDIVAHAVRHENISREDIMEAVSYDVNHYLLIKEALLLTGYIMKSDETFMFDYGKGEIVDG